MAGSHVAGGGDRLQDRVALHLGLPPRHLTEIFGDAVAVAAMVDRLVHHADVHVLRGDSYRLKDKNKDVLGPDTG